MQKAEYKLDILCAADQGAYRRMKPDMAAGLSSGRDGGFRSVLYGVQFFLLPAGVLYAFCIFNAGGGGVYFKGKARTGIAEHIITVDKSGSCG